MLEDKKTVSAFLKVYYDEKKRLIDTIAFVGVISTLFLQITQFQGEALRTVQALLLAMFSGLLIYLLVNFWITLVASIEETPKTIVVNGMILSTLIGLFILNLLKFIYTSFTIELLALFTWTKIGILLFITLNFSDFTNYLDKKIGKTQLWKVVNELVFGTLLYFFMAGIKIVPYFIIFVCLITCLSMLQSFGLITKKTTTRLVILIGIITIFIILMLQYHPTIGKIASPFFITIKKYFLKLHLNF